MFPMLKKKEDKVSFPILDDTYLPRADVFTTSQLTPVSTPNDAILQDKTNAPSTSAHVQSLDVDRKGSISPPSDPRILLNTSVEEENKKTDILPALPPLNSIKDQFNKSKRKKNNIHSLIEKPEATPKASSKLEGRATRSSSKLEASAKRLASLCLQYQRSKFSIVIHRLSQKQINSYEKKNNASSPEKIIKDSCETDQTTANIEQDGSKGRLTRNPTPTTVKNSVDVDKNSNVSSNPLSDTESGYGRSRTNVAATCFNNSVSEKIFNQNNFASSLGLHPRNTAAQASTRSHSESRNPLNLPALLKADYVKRKSSQKGRGKAPQQIIKIESDQNLLKKFLRVTGAPITSGLGQKLCMEFGKVGKKDLEKYRQKEAQFCQGKEETTKFRQKKYLNVFKKVTTNNFHLYTFNRVQRLTRNQELVLGLSYKSFPAFNKIKLNPKIRLNRVSQALIRKSRRWNFMRKDTLSTLQATILINPFPWKR